MVFPRLFSGGFSELPGFAFVGIRQMHVVDPLAGELAVLPEPGKLGLVAGRLIAAVFLPVDIRIGAEDAGALLATVSESGKASSRAGKLAGDVLG